MKHDETNKKQKKSKAHAVKLAQTWRGYGLPGAENT